MAASTAMTDMVSDYAHEWLAERLGPTPAAQAVAIDDAFRRLRVFEPDADMDALVAAARALPWSMLQVIEWRIDRHVIGNQMEQTARAHAWLRYMARRAKIGRMHRAYRLKTRRRRP